MIKHLLLLFGVLPILCMVLGVVLAVWLVDGQMLPLAVIGMGLGCGAIPFALLSLTAAVFGREDPP